jgi:hypothetical protein
VRVTNDQIDAEIICANSKGCSGCQREGDDCSQVTESNIAAFLDLKEAREIIKEMRAGLEYIDCLNINPSTTELSNTARWAFASQKAKGLLKKSKDYA